MRISDWSSDVCSSDLQGQELRKQQAGEAWGHDSIPGAGSVWRRVDDVRRCRRHAPVAVIGGQSSIAPGSGGETPQTAWGEPRPVRSEERRVGKEWVSACRSRWSQYHVTTKQTDVRRERRGRLRKSTTWLLDAGDNYK